MNNRILGLAAAAALATSLLSPLQAQQPHHAEINIGHAGVATLKADMTYLLELTSPTEQEQLVNILDFIDLLAFGVDEARPMRVDVLSGITPPLYVIWGPYEKLEDLKGENIEAQFPLKKSAENLWELLPPDIGWFRSLSDQKYAIMVLTNPNDHSLLKQIILKLSNPMPAIEPLLLNGANVGVRLANTALTPEDQQKRKDSFGEIRSNRMAALEKRPTESVTEFELRKGVASAHLNEIERLLVESLETNLSIFLDKKNGSAKVKFTAAGIEDSSFAKSLALFGQSPDSYASVGKHEESVLSLRLNHPIDDLRKSNVKTIIELMEKDTEDRLKQNEKLSATEKEASQKLFDGVVEVLLDGLNSGNVNAFLETIVTEEGEFVSYGAASAVKGGRLDEVLALIAKTGKGNKVKTEVAKVGDVKIHEIMLAEGYCKIFDRLFGVERVFYIGTSEDKIWLGTGQPSLELLKKAISDLKEPEKNDVVITIEGHLLPWAKRTLKLIEDHPEPSALDEQQSRREHLRAMKIAVEALAEKDDARFEMKVTDGKADGEISVNEGMLKFIGRQISLYSKNNLQ